MGTVILGTLGLQIVLLQNAVAARLFKTMILKWPDLIWIAAVSLIPLAILELMKQIQSANRYNRCFANSAAIE